MNKEDFIGKLQMIYVGDRNAIDEIISEYDRLNNIINEAKEECKSVIEDSEHTTASEFNINGLMRIMLKILNKGGISKYE